VDPRSFSYDLPSDRVARFPVSPRDSARLLVCSRSDAGRIEHRRVRDLDLLLAPGDLLVINDTKVLPHRLIGHRPTGGRVECLVLERRGCECEGFLRPAAKLRQGEIVQLEDGALTLVVGERLERGRFRFRLTDAGGDDPGPVIDRVGRAPLPPYLGRRPEDEDVELDRERYQTVFASRPGAVAAPTAGLHLTEELLARCKARDIGEVRVTLHVGEGTFEPIRADRVEDHRMHEERFEVSAEGAARVEEARGRGGRVICVGTTSARAIESCYDPATGRVEPSTGRTGLFLYPGRGPNVLDGLLTNFHLPESTLLLLVASILGRQRLLDLYALAIAEGYRFYSFGDAMLILP